ncbi:E3 ubiquitin/ISG15 ligase TRIM25-like [Rana temporaria]|uniref:E3 ubiquitin/ISG15 ligase TRIM25-like n=1 Tax=Rana temporaria TaxID=8407 RepID=UPI001AACFB80|nr:E3 ubiquitin/ISG15 ligase TRIM25-like [Rana temporaria]
MASAGLRKELECSVCLNVYTDPVTLRCGHNFCRVCIDRVLDTQVRSGGYSCPECRQEFYDRPALQRNITLCNIVENFLSAQPDLEESGVHCTYCFNAHVPAIRSCVLCEASLCENHLSVHSNSPEHILCDPTTSLQNRKCSIHRKILEYYCTEDSACICVSCCLIGKHKGHQMESLDVAYGEKKKKLRNILQKLMVKKEETEKSIQSLLERRQKVQKKGHFEAEIIAALFRDLRRQLEDLEKRVQLEISRQAELVLLSVSDLIQILEIKKDELSRKMHHIEELCNTTDPLTVLQKSDTGDLCDTEDGDRDRHTKLLHDGGDLDVFRISHTLDTGLSDIISVINGGIYIPKAVDILLDVNSAHPRLSITDDLKCACGLEDFEVYPQSPQRFESFQVLSNQSFSSGRHYLEMDLQGEYWTVGVCYPSIDRKGPQSSLGNNNKSWCLSMCYDEEDDDNEYLVSHDSKSIILPVKISVKKIRIYLDYEVGQLSFYAMCDSIRHLHTFIATFTEPLHIALGVQDGSIRISSGESGEARSN